MRHKPDITRDAAVSLLLLRDNSLERRVLKILEMAEAGTTFAIRDLAAEFRLSPAYLQRLFKSETGICMGEWLSEQRLQRPRPIGRRTKANTRRAPPSGFKLPEGIAGTPSLRALAYNAGIPHAFGRK